jgi:RHS repeat-associated protein
MSDLGAIVKDGAEDMAEGGERAGAAIVDHYQGIGSELEKAGERYSTVESDTEQSFQNVIDGGAKDAENATSDVRGLTPGADSPPRDLDPATGGGGVGDDLGDETEQEAQEGAHLQGESGSTEDPIDVVTGEMFLVQRDLALPGVLPLLLERRHGSSYRHGRRFGVTWASTLDQRIEADEDEIHFAAADGRVLHYPVPTTHGQRVMPSHGPRWALAWDREDDVITVSQDELGVVLHFRPGPHPGSHRPLSVVTDRAGNRITYIYGEDGVPTDVYHSGGYHLVLEPVYTRGGVRIGAVRLADPAGGPDLPVREFRYDRAGRLTDVLDASRSAQVFEYDGSDRITRWTDRNGHSYRYTYREDGRVSAAQGDDGFLDVALDYDFDAQTTTLTDALGHATVFHWNELLQTVKVVDALGHETLVERDGFGQVLVHTDQLGRATRYERDDRGRPLRVQRPDGTVVALEYDGSGKPVTVTGAGGSIWRYLYNEAGALIEACDPTGAVTRYGYDARGRLSSVTDPLGAATAITCDNAGLPIQVVDPCGAENTIRRDAFGRIVALVDPLGATTELSWTADGRIAERRHPDGSVERWEYDPEGCLLARTEPGGAVTRYEYGPFDRPVARIEPDGARYEFAYDRQLQLVSVTDPLGRHWSYEYDPAGNLVAETDFAGAALGYEYDAAGQLVRRTNAAGEETVFHLDPLGQVTERHSGDAAYRYTYDPEGNVLRAEGPGTVVEYTRDALGRVLSETLNGSALVNEFDANGQRTRRTTPSRAESQWAFDQAGRPVELRTGEGRLTFAYDPAGRETTMSMDPTAAITQTFDELGRLTGQAVWSYDQAAAPQPQTQTQAEGGNAWRAVQTRTYAYRPDGIPSEITDLLRGTRRLRWDAAGRPTGVDAGTWQESYAYDAMGNVAAASTPATQQAGDDGSREYLKGRLHRARGDVYEYDLAGRVVRRTRRTLSGQVKEWSYNWDAESRLTSVALPDGTVWQYTYDALGRRVAKEAVRADGTRIASVSFTWDGARLTEEASIGADGRTTVITWDYRPGSFTSVAQTRCSWVDAASRDEVDREFHAIVADLVGRPLELVSPTGRIAWHTTTTVWGETIAAPGSQADCPLRFPGQYHDAETGLDYNYNRYYDPATAAYLSPDPLGLLAGPRAYAYVGNPMTRTDPLGLCPSDPDRGAPAYITDSNGVTSVRPPGRPDNDLVFSGHGAIAAGDTGMTTVPEGTTLNMYSPHNTTISDALGNKIETGNPAAMYTFKPGDQVPDYLLFPPGAPLSPLNIKGSPVTVTGPTRLSDLLKPNMGNTHWAACRQVVPDSVMKSILAKY